MIRFLTACCTCIVLLARPAGAAPMFIQPLEGEPYVDWTIVNYVDLDPISPGIMDYRGGGFSYDGHNGTDFTLANFVAMDSGFAVYAAATGTVIETHDGEFDRNNAETNAPSNYVKIGHGANCETWYWHLRKNSIIVTNGQVVAAGQKIAEVGSSGNSTDAHLHFEVRIDGNPIDPFLAGLWFDPLPYAGDSPGVLDTGIHDQAPTFPQLKERLTNDVIIALDNPHFVHWVQVHGLTPTNTMSWHVYRPNGSRYKSWTNNPGGLVRYGWYYAGWARPVSGLSQTLPWRSVFKVDGVEWTEVEFYVGGVGDTDGDDIDDFLEVAPLEVGQDDRLVDSDGDGTSNAGELLAGTKPGAADSHPCFTNFVHRSSDAVELSFESAAGRFYVVESCTNLSAGNWEYDHPVPRVAGNTSSRAVADTGGAGTKFYRLQLLVEP